ncbi:MAG: tRNA (N6-isopentenyl adenosine(37)-C2)-methylthiotransferase MiaB [Candidatus Paceibacterota bacterium]|jgi:tRNA-2-methylthio-N6-dimethylallyladenosine synthase
MKYQIITFGCQMNRSDSERIASVLESLNYKKTLNQKEADLVIVNMCSVRQSAVDRVYGLIPQFKALKTKNKAFKTVLTGCVLKPERTKLAEVFDFVLDKEHLDKWPELMKGKEVKANRFNYLNIVPRHQSKIQAFVPISNGCDNFCTYCAVPFTRGRLVSRNHKDILKEVKDLVNKGYKEIWLLGENVNSYYSKGVDFSKLIKEIDKIKGKFWLRFTSPHPKDFSDELIKTLKESKKFVPYLNLPVQSGDNTILRKMNRPYTREKYLALVKKIKKTFNNNISISTDIIVGFPDETEAQFKNSEKLMKEVQFDLAFISEYSPRPQSFSCEKLTNNVLKKDKKRRAMALNQILKETALKNNLKLLNKEVDVLVLEKDGEYCNGRTGENKAIRFKSNEDLSGKFVKVKIIKATAWNFEGILVKPKLVVVLGPTASGKTDLAIDLAKKFSGEIVTADSRTIYKGMDIGTAKPKELKGVPHYLIDIVSPDEDFNVALFKQEAVKKINEIIEKGKLPILVGGTGLYIKSIIENLDFPSVKADEKLRNKLEKKGTEELFEMYKSLDKEGAIRIDKNNRRRLIRAIEVSLSIKEPFFKERKKEPIYDVLQLGIKINKKELEERIKKRVDLMIKQGLEKEVRKLSNKYGFNISPMQTIGYREWEDYFNKKESLENTIEKIKTNTIKFAKRQMTWFKKDKTIKWI